MPSSRAILDSLPRLGWVEAPSPITPLPDRAAALGLGWLGVKRDDLLEPLWGGTKVRKLDGLLAAPPWSDAPALGSVGATGSGHLVALAAAGERLGRAVHAVWFWSSPTPHAVENMAFVATRATLRYHGSRLSMALTQPQALFSGRRGEIAWVPPGGTTEPGMTGLVRAGLELAQQVRDGLLPAPDHILLALGSGGTAVGLAIGLALAGLRPTIHAVSVVERLSAPALRLRRIQSSLMRWLAERGVDPAEPAPIVVEHGQLGAGYGLPTRASWAATRELQALGLPAEPSYTGKAWGALPRLAALHRGETILFWDTLRRGPIPVVPAWREALPQALRRRLDASPTLLPGALAPTRRGLLVGGAALLVAAGGVARVTGYSAFPAWHGAVLRGWEAEVLRAAAEAILPPAPLDAATLDAIPARVDRFLASLSDRAQLEIHGLFVLIEHGTALDSRAWRFSRLSTESRVSFLGHLGTTWPGHLASKGLRDLALLGYYQSPETWPAIGYGGPWVPSERPPDSTWEALRAPAGALPRSAA